MIEHKVIYASTIEGGRHAADLFILKVIDGSVDAYRKAPSIKYCQWTPADQRYAEISDGHGLVLLVHIILYQPLNDHWREVELGATEVVLMAPFLFTDPDITLTIKQDTCGIVTSVFSFNPLIFSVRFGSGITRFDTQICADNLSLT